jgi:hypothetical protein
MTTTMITTPGGGSGVTVLSVPVRQVGFKKMQHPCFGTHATPLSVRVARTTRYRCAEDYLSRQLDGFSKALTVIAVLSVIFNFIGFFISDTVVISYDGFYLCVMASVAHWSF